MGLKKKLKELSKQIKKNRKASINKKSAKKNKKFKEQLEGRILIDTYMKNEKKNCKLINDKIKAIGLRLGVSTYNGYEIFPGRVILIDEYNDAVEKYNNSIENCNNLMKNEDKFKNLEKLTTIEFDDYRSFPEEIVPMATPIGGSILCPGKDDAITESDSSNESDGAENSPSNTEENKEE